MARSTLGPQPEAIVNGKFEGRNAEAIQNNFETLFRRLRLIRADGSAGPHTILSESHTDTAVANAASGDLLVRLANVWQRLAVGAADTVLTALSGTPTWAKLVNANIDAAAAIAWSKINKTGSSLADLTTRSASDLSSGTVAVARLGAGVSTVVVSTATGFQNDWAPGISGDTLIDWSSGGLDITISGFAGGVAGQRITFRANSSGGLAKFMNLSGGSLSANQLDLNNIGLISFDVGAVMFQHNGTRWQLVSDPDASHLSKGTLPDARFPATLPAASGVNLTNLNGTNIASGTVANARLSTDVPLKNATNAFTGANSFATNPLDLLVGQLKFPATQNASSNANTLDDYEEGTWTPIDSSGVGLSFTFPIGAIYVKVGKIVYASGGVTYPATASGSNALIGGLPFTSGSVQGGAYIFYTTLGVLPMVFIGALDTRLQLFNPATAVAYTNANLSGKDLRFTLMYEALS